MGYSAELVRAIGELLDCAYSLEPFDDPHTTTCDHTFSLDTLTAIRDDRGQQAQDCPCPTCKEPNCHLGIVSNKVVSQLVAKYKPMQAAVEEGGATLARFDASPDTISSFLKLLVCPATGTIFQYPILLPCGDSVDVSAIEAQTEGFYQCPCCRSAVDLQYVRYNETLQQVVEAMSADFLTDDYPRRVELTLGERIYAALSVGEFQEADRLMHESNTHYSSIRVGRYKTALHMLLKRGDFRILHLLFPSFDDALFSVDALTYAEFKPYLRWMCDAQDLIRVQEFLITNIAHLQDDNKDRLRRQVLQCYYDNIETANGDVIYVAVSRLVGFLKQNLQLINYYLPTGRTLLYSALENLKRNVDTAAWQNAWQILLGELFGFDELDTSLGIRAQIQPLDICVNDRLLSFIGRILKSEVAREGIAETYGFDDPPLQRAIEYAQHTCDTQPQRQQAVAKLWCCLVLDGFFLGKTYPVLYVKRESFAENLTRINGFLPAMLSDIYGLGDLAPKDIMLILRIVSGFTSALQDHTSFRAKMLFVFALLKRCMLGENVELPDSTPLFMLDCYASLFDVMQRILAQNQNNYLQVIQEEAFKLLENTVITPVADVGLIRALQVRAIFRRNFQRGPRWWQSCCCLCRSRDLIITERVAELMPGLQQVPRENEQGRNEEEQPFMFAHHLS
jgi:hypothetical protein